MLIDNLPSGRIITASRALPIRFQRRASQGDAERRFGNINEEIRRNDIPCYRIYRTGVAEADESCAIAAAFNVVWHAQWNGTIHEYRGWMQMKSEDAEMVAIKMIEWLAKDEQAFGNFARVTGVTLEDFKEHASNPEFLASVIDFLLSSEDMVVAFCEDLSLPFDLPMEARRALPGGDAPNWT